MVEVVNDFESEDDQWGDMAPLPRRANSLCFRSGCGLARLLRFVGGLPLLNFGWRRDHGSRFIRVQCSAARRIEKLLRKIVIMIPGSNFDDLRWGPQVQSAVSAELMSISKVRCTNDYYGAGWYRCRIPSTWILKQPPEGSLRTTRRAQGELDEVVRRQSQEKWQVVKW